MKEQGRLAMPQARGAIDTLTGLRAIAAIWVMVFHFVKADGVGGIAGLPELFWRGHLGVDVFFVLSGFVLGYVYVPRFANGVSGTAYREYLLLRLGRIYPLHLATMLALLAGVLILRSQGLEPRNAGGFAYIDLIPNLLLLHAWFGETYLSWNFVSWSISAEWFAYLFLLPLLARWVGPRAVWPILILALTAAFAFEHFMARDPLTGGYVMPYKNALWRVSVEFLAGYATFLVWHRNRCQGWLADALALAGVVLLLLSSADAAGAERYLLLPAIGLLIFGLASDGIVGRQLLARRSMVYLGEISYSIYMIHPLVLIASNLVVRRGWFEPSPAVGLAIFAVDCLLSVALAAVAYRWIELPCREFVRSRLEVRRKIAAADAMAT